MHERVPWSTREDKWGALHNHIAGLHSEYFISSSRQIHVERKLATRWTAATMATSPQPATAQHASADEVFAQMSKLPLFMNSLDLPAAGEEENLELVALKALAYEGTKAEIATNFKEQGNEMTSVKRWADAREYYDKAIAALKMSDDELHTARGAPVEDADKDNPADLVLDLRDGERVVDLDVEAAQEKKLLEASLVNRALCNLELSKYHPFHPQINAPPAQSVHPNLNTSPADDH